MNNHKYTFVTAMQLNAVVFAHYWLLYASVDSYMFAETWISDRSVLFCSI